MEHGCIEAAILFSVSSKVTKRCTIFIDFSSEWESNRWEEIFTSTGRRGVLEEKYYGELDRVLPFVATFIDRRTVPERTAPMTRVYTRYSKIIADVKKTTGRRA